MNEARKDLRVGLCRSSQVFRNGVKMLLMRDITKPSERIHHLIASLQHTHPNADQHQIYFPLEAQRECENPSVARLV